MIAAEKVSVAYRQGSIEIPVLSDVSFQIDGGPAALTGPSGSGKSTLLRVLAGLQQADAGCVSTARGYSDATSQRNQLSGVALIYQDYRLVPFLTALENVQLAAELSDLRNRDAEQAIELLNKVGLASKAQQLPDQLSGGEQQRVAIARAIVSGADVLLADEPTGALDKANSVSIAELLAELVDERKMTVMVATHDPEVFGRMAVHLQIDGGKIRQVP